MELFYNPDVMPASEIKATFVGRQWLVDELASLVQHQPDGAGVQHVVVIGPRGMGKTTVLLMVEFAIREGSTATGWQAVRFSEESYDVTDLAEFWMRALSHLAADTNDAELLDRADGLKAEHSDSGELEEAALALLKDWRREHGKRLLLLVDNFDMILAQINDERDNARLRSVLMNDGTLMLIGAATSFFREARAYDQPLYNFFKIYNLEALKRQDIDELLRRRAAVDGAPHFEETLKANTSRLRALEYFTGGSPRLALMLYRVITRSDVFEVGRGLEKLLDEVTPYFKGKIESLPAQQRKILDHIARLSSQTCEGQTPTAIAQATRIPSNQVSSQLRRLSESGYVRAANLRGRNSYYTLSEPLFAVWYQMRTGRKGRQRMQWLIEFLTAWYATQDLGGEVERLQTRFLELLTAGRAGEAQEALTYRRCLAEAMGDSLARDLAIDSIVRSYLRLGDTKTLTEGLLSGISLEKLSIETLEALCEAGCISDGQLVRDRVAEFEHARMVRIVDIIGYLNCIIEAHPDDPQPLVLCGGMLNSVRMGQEALAYFERALCIKPDNERTWYHSGRALFDLNRFDEAVSSFNRALELNHRDQGPLEDRLDILHSKFVVLVLQGKLDLARETWYELVKTAQEVDLGELSVIKALELTARLGHLGFARQLIVESGMEEWLLPYARALDYLLRGDEGLIEQLSPELRGIVKEVVAKLRKPIPQEELPKPVPSARKTAAGCRRRRQL